MMMTKNRVYIITMQACTAVLFTICMIVAFRILAENFALCAGHIVDIGMQCGDCIMSDTNKNNYITLEYEYAGRAVECTTTINMMNVRKEHMVTFLVHKNTGEIAHIGTVITALIIYIIVVLSMLGYGLFQIGCLPMFDSIWKER